MAYAQKNPLSLTESRPLEGERGLTYWYMLAILCSLFIFFVIYDSSFSSSFFLVLTYVVML